MILPQCEDSYIQHTLIISQRKKIETQYGIIYQGNHNQGSLFILTARVSNIYLSSQNKITSFIAMILLLTQEFLLF